MRVELLRDGELTAVYLSSLAKKSSIQTVLSSMVKSGMETGAFSGGWQLQDMESTLADLLRGYTLVHRAGGWAVSYDTSGWAGRRPAQPTSERVVRGPHVGFDEELRDNLSMIRQNLQDPDLRAVPLRIGRRTRTDIAVLYLEDVADPGLVEEIHDRLNRIDIDGILDSGYIQQLISDNRWSIFPLTQATERPDKTISALLEGRVALLVQGSPYAILVPTTVNELYQSPEDYYTNWWTGSFLRFFRVLGNNIAVALPGLYIALVGVNPALLPIKFALTVSGSRTGVAMPLIVELLLMETIMEIFREASLRLPGTVSQTLGVVAGIVLGMAGVAAGLVSQATLLVVVLTAIASFSGPNYAIGLSWRILKFGLIFCAAALGLYGLTLGGLAILAHAAIQNSFGVAYLAPWAPMRIRAMTDTIIRRPIWLGRRPSTYHPIDEVRYREEEPKQDD